MISKILDMMEKLVQPNKEEEPMTMLGVPITGINANTSTVTATIYPTQYTQGLSAQNAGGNYPLTGIFGGAGGAGNVQATTIYGQAQAYTTYANQTNAIGYHVVLPPMSGVPVSMGFVDANGIASVIMVDQAYMQVLQEISRNMQMTYGNQHTHLQQSPYAGQPHLKMLEGDFSEEEMTEAEGIIAELEGKSGSEAPHP